MDNEPEIVLGGANFNADPIGARILYYPIAVILDQQQTIKYEKLKQKLGLSDREILLTFHPCFVCDNMNN